MKNVRKDSIAVTGMLALTVAFTAASEEPAKPTMALGRVQMPAGTPPSPPMTMCEHAAAARARNSPTAPALEKRCAAEGGPPPPIGFGRVHLPAEAASAVGPPFDPATAAAQINDRVAKAGVIGPPFDPATASAQIYDPVAKAGAVGPPYDPASAAAQISDPVAKAGAVAPPYVPAAVSVAAAPPIDPAVLDTLAATGADIAQIDPAVAEARNAETGAFYQLGFDIATAIFGDPALGAQANTSMGPGSQRIRDTLSATGQRGFDASVKFHLARDYSH